MLTKIEMAAHVLVEVKKGRRPTRVSLDRTMGCQLGSDHDSQLCNQAVDYLIEQNQIFDAQGHLVVD